MRDGVEPESRVFKTVTPEGTIAPLDTVRFFFLDTISEGGRSDLFAKEIVQVTELTQEVLTLVMPRILFKFHSASALSIFSETFAAHLSVCGVVPELHIEVDFAGDMSEHDREELASWTECELPHGREVNTHDQFQQWVRAIQPLPSSTNIHLVFSRIWRDFRALRGLSKKFDLPGRTITFQFPTPSKHVQQQDHEFFVAQTIVAMKDMEIPEQAGISDNERVRLVKFGCRGFNSGRRLTV